jgi:uncharacterized protein YndB with AHSA1/START domain
MSSPDFRYVAYIAASPSRVWEALTDGAVTAVWFDEPFGSDWTAFRSFAADGRVAAEGRVVESDPPRRLALTWERARSGDGELHAMPRAVATLRVEPLGEVVRLVVTEHHGAPADPAHAAGGVGAWPIALCRLKTQVETGRAMPAFCGE